MSMLLDNYMRRAWFGDTLHHGLRVHAQWHYRDWVL